MRGVFHDSTLFDPEKGLDQSQNEGKCRLEKQPSVTDPRLPADRQAGLERDPDTRVCLVRLSPT